MAYTTANLIADVELRTFAPTDRNTFSAVDVLLLADASMQTTILPLLQTLRGEWFVTHADEAVTASQSAYDIPARALGMQLRDVQLVTSAGDVVDLGQIVPEQVQTTATGEIQAFYLRGNKVYLYPTPGTTLHTLRKHFFLRPGKLVATTAAGLISSIDTVAKQVVVSSIPTAWTTSSTYDLIRQDGASEPLAIDQSVSGIASTTITFVSTLPTSLRVNDYVALADETPLLPIPAELRPVLAQDVATQIIGSMGLPGFDNAMKRLKIAIDAATTMLSPRVLGEVTKMIARHGWI